MVYELYNLTFIILGDRMSNSTEYKSTFGNHILAFSKMKHLKQFLQTLPISVNARLNKFNDICILINLYT